MVVVGTTLLSLEAFSCSTVYQKAMERLLLENQDMMEQPTEEELLQQQQKQSRNKYLGQLEDNTFLMLDEQQAQAKPQLLAQVESSKQQSK